jgi:ADP-heptose:LPS heptosyltransferase
VTWLSRGLEWILEVGLHRRRPRVTPPFVPEEVRRILVARKDNIGDVLCTRPALRALRRAFPDAHLAILVAEHCRAAVERNPDLDEVLAYTKAKHHPGFLGLPALWELSQVIRDLRRRRFDLAIAMGRPCSRSSAWLAYVSGACWRLGYSTPALRPFPFFLNLRCDPGTMTSHEVDGCLELLATLGIPSAGRKLTLIPDPGAQAAIRERLAELGAGREAGLALVHISNRREARRWPLAAFAQAADAIHDRLGLSILLSWAPGDAENPLFPGDDGKAEEVAGRVRSRPILLRTPALSDLVAAVSLCDFVLSTDGGLMHIAAAMDIPQVVIFGKTGTTHWAPVTEKSALLRRDGRADRFSVEEVVTAAMDVMARGGRAAVGAPAAVGRGDA